MKPDLKRIIIFTANVPLLLEFYLELLNTDKSYIDEDKKWGEIYLSNINIAFHHSKIKMDRHSNFKLVFYSRDIEKCREKIIKRGYNAGKIFTSGKLMMFNLNDPERNIIQFSNRK